jgi:hypothetical protein
MLKRMNCRPALCISIVLSIPLLAVQSMTLAGTAFAQAATAPVPAQPESAQDLVARLTPQQNQLFEDAKAAHRAHRYSDASASFKLLLGQLPGDPILSKYASNTAINAGDVTFALNTVKPVAQADPNDWQAAALLTRACAESGDTSCRDSGIAHMLELHSRGITPSGMQDYVVEEVKVGENTLQIWASLEPWGYYKVYDTGRAMDKAGNLYLTLSIESSDFDQPSFANNHPKEAAQGLRGFSLDAYRETGLNSAAQRTQTHYTYKFLVGQPPHDTVHQEFISVVNGKTAPISSRSNLVVPQ